MGKQLFTKFDIRWGYKNHRIKEAYKAAFKTMFQTYILHIVYFVQTTEHLILVSGRYFRYASLQQVERQNSWQRNEYVTVKAQARIRVDGPQTMAHDTARVVARDVLPLVYVCPRASRQSQPALQNAK